MLSLFKLRVKIVGWLSRIFLGPIAGRIPKSVVGDALEVVDKNIYRGVLEVERLIDDAHIEVYQFPEYFPFRFPRSKAYNAKHIYSVRGGSFSVRSGVVFLDDLGKVLLQSVGSLNRFLGWGNVVPEILDSSTAGKVSGNVIVCPDTGYFHWLLEVMPNAIHCLNHLQYDLKIVIPEKPSRYLVSALRYLLGDRYHDVTVNAKLIVQGERVYFSTYEDRSGYVRKCDIDVMRNTFCDRIVQSNVSSKIYVSRGKSSKRRLGNEKQVEEALAQIGFEIVYSEELEFVEQIELFSSATTVVAPHGAGLANVIWCNQSSRLLEIFPYDNLHSCYATLAASRGVYYRYIECMKDSESSGIVDIDELIRGCNELLG